MVKKKIIFSSIIVLIVGILIILSQNASKKANADNDDLTSSISYSFNEGNFYLDGDINNCYFQVTNDTIQLIGSKEQLNVLYVNQSSLNSSYDEYYESLQDEWKSPMPYTIESNEFNGKIRWRWNFMYDKNEELFGSFFDYYIDENTLVYRGNRFIRID